MTLNSPAADRYFLDVCTLLSIRWLFLKVPQNTKKKRRKFTKIKSLKWLVAWVGYGSGNRCYYDARSTAERPLWYCVDVKLIKKFSRFISLEEIKSHPGLKALWILRRGNRLSITPLREDEGRALEMLGD